MTYAEPVLLPANQNKIQQSPKNTLRKPIQHHSGMNADNLFQYQGNDNYNNRDFRVRDNFGTLRSHQVNIVVKTELLEVKMSILFLFHRERTTIGDAMAIPLPEVLKR